MAAGIPLSRALDSACAGSGFSIFSEKVKTGSSFSGSLDPGIFPPPVIAMISVGENNGNLASGIAKACGYMEKKDSFKKKLIGSMMYPAFVLILCFAAAIVLAFLSHYFLDIFPHVEYSIENIKKNRETFARIGCFAGHRTILSVYC